MANTKSIYSLSKVMKNPETVFKGSDYLYYQYYEEKLQYCKNPYADDEWLEVDLDNYDSYFSNLYFYFEYCSISCPSLG